MPDRSKKRARLHARPATTLGLALTIAGCGNLTAGGATAKVSVSGNYESPAPAPSPVVAGAGARAPIFLVEGAEEAEGEIEIDLQVYLVSELGSAIRLGGEELRVNVDLQGAMMDEAVRERIAATRYSALRVVFTKIQAQVERGLVINGVPVVGEVHVQLEDISLEVLRPIDLEVFEGQSVELVIDLNAPAWLAAVDPVTHTVDQTVFAALVDVVVP